MESSLRIGMTLELSLDLSFQSRRFNALSHTSLRSKIQGKKIYLNFFPPKYRQLKSQITALYLWPSRDALDFFKLNNIYEFTVDLQAGREVDTYCMQHLQIVILQMHEHQYGLFQKVLK